MINLFIYTQYKYNNIKSFKHLMNLAKNKILFFILVLTFIHIHFLNVIPGVGVAPLPIIEPGVGEVFPPTPAPILDESITPPLNTLLGGVTGLFAPD